MDQQKQPEKRKHCHAIDHWVLKWIALWIECHRLGGAVTAANDLSSRRGGIHILSLLH